MPKVFDAVGFSVAGRDELAELISTAHSRAESESAVVEHASGTTAIYRDPSGALLAIHVNADNELVCVQPSFHSELQIRWRPQSVVPDEDCALCDLVFAERLARNDEMVYPFAMRVESIGTDRELIPFGEPAEARLVGLCQSGEVWPDENAFCKAPEAHVSDGPPRVSYGARSFIPSGTFSAHAMSPHALVHGIVESVEERRNALTGGSFRVARLDTYGGLVDTCWASGEGEGLAPGAVAKANLWLVGSPLTLREHPGPVPVRDAS